jgi:hypothetical protein
MPEEYVDPSGNTEQFRAFVHRAEPAPDNPARPRLLAIGVVAIVIVAIAVIAILAVG